MRENRKKIVADQGFTLVELLIAMVVAGLATMATYSVYVVQQQSYTAQNQVTEMQQNLRAALNLMARDIRMAGYDEEGSTVASIVDAKPDLFSFTFDRNDDGDIDDPGEHIAYDTYVSSGIPILGRTTDNDDIAITGAGAHWEATGHQPAAENIESLEFQYLDSEGNVTTTEAEISTVVISILARANHEDPKFHNTMTYTTSGGTDWVKDDHYRRRFQTMTVECRNAGLD